MKIFPIKKDTVFIVFKLILLAALVVIAIIPAKSLLNTLSLNLTEKNLDLIFFDGTILAVILFLTVFVFFNIVRTHSSNNKILTEKKLDTFRYIINNLPLVILIVDNKGNIQMANRAFYEYSSLLPGEAVGTNIRNIKGIRNFSDEYENIWQTILTGEKWQEINLVEVPEGKNYWEKTTILPLIDTDGNIYSVILLGEDITLHKKAEKEIREANNIKAKFTSMVSHELRTPLTVIKEIINIVLRGSAGEVNDEQKDFLETARRNVDRLSRLVNDVLDFQKLGSGKMPFHMEPHNLNEVILEIYRSMSLLASDKGINFDLELDDDIPNLMFDKDKIIQVLTNLVNNAIKFTDYGSIKIETSRGNNVVHVIVHDTGVGMPQEEMSKLFKPFEQLGDPETRPSGGTGLGLVISKEIIIKHSGRIWAESEFGKGSSFHFILPIHEMNK